MPEGYTPRLLNLQEFSTTPGREGPHVFQELAMSCSPLCSEVLRRDKARQHSANPKHSQKFSLTTSGTD